MGLAMRHSPCFSWSSCDDDVSRRRFRCRRTMRSHWRTTSRLTRSIRCCRCRDASSSAFSCPCKRKYCTLECFAHRGLNWSELCEVCRKVKPKTSFAFRMVLHSPQPHFLSCLFTFLNNFRGEKYFEWENVENCEKNLFLFGFKSKIRVELRGIGGGGGAVRKTGCDSYLSFLCFFDFFFLSFLRSGLDELKDEESYAIKM